MHYPDQQLIKQYFGYGILLYIQFILIYGLTNYLASNSNNIHVLSFSWELDIEYIPIFILPYISLSLFIILPIFYLNIDKMKSWAKSYMMMNFIAGFIFLVFPTQHVTERFNQYGDYANLFSLLYSLDLPYNLFPSLHVSLSSLALFIINPLIKNRITHTGIYIWWLFMSASVIFIGQHHISDVFGGILLAWICYKYVFIGISQNSELNNENQ